MKSDAAASEFSSGDLYIDHRSRMVKVNGRKILLTHKEYALLKELTLNAGTVLSYAHLLHTIWGIDYIDDRQYLHHYICCLRKKIEPAPRNPVYIRTIPKEGYIFRHDE